MKKANTSELRAVTGGYYRCNHCGAIRFLKVDMGYHLLNHWINGQVKWGQWAITIYK